MNPWLRLLAVFGVAIAAALFLKVLPPVIVLAFFIGGFAALNLGLRRRVKTERAGFRSGSLGLKREQHDPFGLLGYPFALFSRCGQAAIEDLRWGVWRGLEVKRFDLSCSPTSGDERRLLACAIGPAGPAPLPLVIEDEVWATLLDEPGIQTVEAGSNGPDRAHVVRCGDPGLARALVGVPMVRWLEDLQEPWGFELNGSLALVYGPPSVGLEGPLERLEAFAELVRAAMPRSDAAEAASSESAGTETVSPGPPDATTSEPAGWGEAGEQS
jgi:hypothetical protein